MSNYLTKYRCKNCGELFYGEVTEELPDIPETSETVGEYCVDAKMNLFVNSIKRNTILHICNVERTNNRIKECGIGEFIGLSVLMS